MGKSTISMAIEKRHINSALNPRTRDSRSPFLRLRAWNTPWNVDDRRVLLFGFQYIWDYNDLVLFDMVLWFLNPDPTWANWKNHDLIIYIYNIYIYIYGKYYGYMEIINGYLVGGLEHEFYCSSNSWECHHPNWRTHIFQRGRYTTNQYISEIITTSLRPHWNHR